MPTAEVVWGFIILILFGLPFLGFGFLLLCRAVWLSRNGVRVEGLVVDRYVSPKDPDGTSYPVVEFVDRAGARPAGPAQVGHPGPLTCGGRRGPIEGR